MELSREKIEDYLRNYTDELDYIQRRRRQMKAEQQGFQEELIRMVSLPGMTEAVSGYGEGCYVRESRPENLDQVLKKMDALKEEQHNWQQRRSEALDMEQAELDRMEQELQSVLHALELLPTREYQVLKALYIQKMKWSVVCQELDISEATISRTRNRGIKRIAEICRNGV